MAHGRQKSTLGLIRCFGLVRGGHRPVMRCKRGSTRRLRFPQQAFTFLLDTLICTYIAPENRDATLFGRIRSDLEMQVVSIADVMVREVFFSALLDDASVCVPKLRVG